MTEAILKSRKELGFIVILSILFFCAMPFGYRTLSFAIEQPAVTVKQEILPTVRLGSTNGTSYDLISPDQFLMPVWIKGTCFNGKKLQGAWVEFVGWSGSTQEVYLGDLPHNATNLKWKNVNLPSGLVSTSASELPDGIKYELYHACYKSYLDQGLSKEEAFSQTRILQGIPIGELSGCLACYNDGELYQANSCSYEAKYPAKFKIVCEKYTPSGKVQGPIAKPVIPKGGLAQAIHVTQANLIPFQKTENGKCEVTLSATVVTDGKTKVNYQFENQLGDRSVVRTVNIGNSHKAHFTETFDFAKSGQEMWFKPPAKPTTKGPSYAASPTEKTQGYFKMLVLSPTKLESNPASYNMKCEQPKGIKKAVVAAPVPGDGGDQQIKNVKMAKVAMPDLQTKPGIEIGGVKGAWGGMINVNANQAVETSNGACLFKYLIDLQNLGTAATGPFEYRLRAGTWSIVQGHPGLAPNTSGKGQGKIALKPGIQDVVVAVDNMNKISETNEQNNIPKALKVNVVGNCNGAGKSLQPKSNGIRRKY
jgi:hypothetical protein